MSTSGATTPDATPTPSAGHPALRIGVLGASRIAESAIVAPARELGARLVAVAARDKERATAFAAQHGVERVLADYGEVINDPEVDLIYNPLANSLHGVWNRAAIAAGKPVLSEKPFARNVAEATEVAEAARAAGVPVIEGFHYRFHPLLDRVLGLLSESAIGELRHVEIEMGMPEPDGNDPRWRYELAGGSIMDLGCYGIHLFRTLAPFAGGAPRITAASAAVREKDVDESSIIEVSYPSGATGHNSNTMVADRYVFRAHLLGSGGEMVLHDFLSPTRDNRLTVITDHDSWTEYVSTRATYTYQLEAVQAALRTGAALPYGLDDAVSNMDYIDTAYRAAGLSPR